MNGLLRKLIGASGGNDSIGGTEQRAGIRVLDLLYQQDDYTPKQLFRLLLQHSRRISS
jgi:hypothetical protein